jgi:hypothetical protein
MRKLALFALAAIFFLSSHVVPANAQASRTWVSGVGDDANPCSRTAPCKTFAGAISKTAAGGEISVLDPGGFGALTITKSISIMAQGAEGSVLVSGTNGIVVAAGASDVVSLRGLSFEGLGGGAGSPGTNGISFTSGAALHVENCVVRGFAQNGISFTPSASAALFVSDSTFKDNVGAGIHVSPTGGNAEVNVVRVQAENNGSGFRAVSGGGSIDFSATDSVATGSAGAGFVARATSGAVQMMLQHVTSSFNAVVGVNAGSSATVWLGNSSVTANTVGLEVGGGGQVLSFGNNQIAGNTTDGAPSGPVALQ